MFNKNQNNFKLNNNSNKKKNNNINDIMNI